MKYILSAFGLRECGIPIKQLLYSKNFKLLCCEKKMYFVLQKELKVILSFPLKLVVVNNKDFSCSPKVLHV